MSSTTTLTATATTAINSFTLIPSSPLEIKSSRFSFTSLPAEIRNEIYHHLFSDVTLGINTIHTTGSPCPSFCTCSFPWAIASTCRQLRAETTPLLLRSATLEITNHVEKTALLPDKYISSIPRAVVLDAKILHTTPTMTALTSTAKSGFQLDRFHSLRVLELRNLSVWCQYYEESYLRTDAADECMFNLAMFNLRRISPALIDLCDDPARTFKVLLGCQYVGNSMRHETVQAVIDVDTKEILQKSKGDIIRDRNEWSGFY